MFYLSFVAVANDEFFFKRLKDFNKTTMVCYLSTQKYLITLKTLFEAYMSYKDKRHFTNDNLLFFSLLFLLMTAGHS